MSEVSPLVHESVSSNLEAQLEGAKQLVERREIALRLYSNADFRKLILEGFCLHDCAQFAQNSSDPSLGEKERADALAMSQAAGHLRRFLSMTAQMGYVAQHDIPKIEDAILQARAEEDLD